MTRPLTSQPASSISSPVREQWVTPKLMRMSTGEAENSASPNQPDGLTFGS